MTVQLRAIWFPEHERSSRHENMYIVDVVFLRQPNVNSVVVSHGFGYSMLIIFKFNIFQFFTDFGGRVREKDQQSENSFSPGVGWCFNSKSACLLPRWPTWVFSSRLAFGVSPSFSWRQRVAAGQPCLFCCYIWIILSNIFNLHSDCKWEDLVV